MCIIQADCGTSNGEVVLTACRAKFHETAVQHIRKQLQLLKAELPLPPENDSALASMAAAGFGSHVLEDDQCEDEDTEQSSEYWTAQVDAVL